MKTMIQAAAVILFAASAAHAQQAVQWRVEDGGNGHWYQVVACPTQVSWFEARGRAREAGGHLASLTSQAENEWVHAMTVGAPGAWGAWSGGWEYGPWIGGFRAAPGDSQWKWVTAEPWGFTAWHPSQPDSAGQIAVSFGGGGSASARWADTFPDEPVRSFVIEWSADCNNDGIVDYGQILGGQFDDVNRNGIPDRACECLGDLDADGAITGADLGQLLAVWGAAAPGAPADLYADGSVDGFDLAYLLAGWGPCSD